MTHDWSHGPTTLNVTFEKTELIQIPNNFTSPIVAWPQVLVFPIPKLQALFQIPTPVIMVESD